MRYLLDTNAFLYAVRAPEKLSAKAFELLSDNTNRLIVPALVPWELAIKYRAGKLPEAEPIIADYVGVITRLEAFSLEHSHTHTLHAGLMDWEHKDPFDRLLAATAILEGLPVISVDSVFDSLPTVTRVW